MKVHLFLIVTLLLFFSIGWLVEAAVLSRDKEKTILTVGAFNIRRFGQSKMRKRAAVEIKRIVEHYDVLLIQEIVDKHGRAIRWLHRMLDLPFDFVISKRLGKKYKEQYAFFYRTDRVKLLGTYQYEDPDDDFKREPFVVKVAPLSNPKDAVSLIALHASPKKATEEIGHLPEVIKKTLDTLGHDSEPVVLGDLNADCRYSTMRKRLRANDYLTVNTNIYDWLIKDGTDTTTGRSHCTYDRIIIRTSLENKVVEYSPRVFDFARWLHLNNKETLAVSDHYPVEVKLKL